jgi:Phosphatidylinositol-4-phosphate 5-Kinase
LKGSTVDREASDKELDKSLPTFKDNDFIKKGIKIIIGLDAKQKLNERLKCDVEFLSKLHLMDYSLLIGIHDIRQAADDAAEGRDGNRSDAHHDSDSEECDSGER